jgi:hypothetical protein
MLDTPALDWGVQIDRVEIKDVALPESMKRSMSRQAEAERERRSRVITAEGELQASRKLAQAAEVMTEHPAALQLRLLQTVVEVAAEKNSTLVLPFPVELLRFLERSTPPDTADPVRRTISPPQQSSHDTDMRGDAAEDTVPPRAATPPAAGLGQSVPAVTSQPEPLATPVPKPAAFAAPMRSHPGRPQR